MRVLEIEQGMIDSQAHKARIIVSKAGEILTFDEYKALMQ
jgi:alpha-galactosidase